MSHLHNLLLRLSAAGAPQRVARILEWAQQTFHADGAAVFVTSETAESGLETRSAIGEIATTAPLLAAEIARVGIPVEPGPLLMPGAGPKAEFLCWPLGPGRAQPRAVLVLQGKGVADLVKARGRELAPAADRLWEALRVERNLAGRPERAASTMTAPEPAAAQPERTAPQDSSPTPEGTAQESPAPDPEPGLTLLTDGLRLPLYSCDLSGAFTYASPAFLHLCGFHNLEALSEASVLFLEPAKRAEELETIRKAGKVDSVHLAVRSGAGARLQIRDSAILLGDAIFGVFVDVTGLVAANAELKDALQVQELLNDTIMAGARQLQRTQGAAIRSLARLAEYRDHTTGFHLQRICEVSRLLAVEVHRQAPYSFRISMEYADDISLSSMLHDVGKVSIPDQILLKPGKLDAGEWEIMKKHTLFGWEVLHKADRELGEQSFLTLAASIALSHHEKFDGTGYPNGIIGEEIPLSARICAVGDVYDALTSSRPYKQAWSHEQAAEQIVKEAGRHFDPVLVRIFQGLEGELADMRRRFPA